MVHAPLVFQPLDWVSWKCKSDPDQFMKDVMKIWNDRD